MQPFHGKIKKPAWQEFHCSWGWAIKWAPAEEWLALAVPEGSQPWRRIICPVPCHQRHPVLHSCKSPWLLCCCKLSEGMRNTFGLSPKFPMEFSAACRSRCPHPIDGAILCTWHRAKMERGNDGCPVLHLLSLLFLMHRKKLWGRGTDYSVLGLIFGFDFAET